MDEVRSCIREALAKIVALGFSCDNWDTDDLVMRSGEVDRESLAHSTQTCLKF